MAYMSEIKKTCDQEGCYRPPTHRVYAYANEPMGRYCEKHAFDRVRALTDAEAVNPAGFRRA